MTFQVVVHDHNTHNHHHIQGVEKKIVLVGIQFDERGRELLDWAMVKVADAGDRVIAINVCKSSDSALKYRKLVDDYLIDYEGLCDHKQVNLTGYVLTGNSVRKMLVREAKFYSASVVIVGVSKIKPFGGCLTIVKYIAKKLPLASEVLAIHDGKVVFQRFSSGQLSGSMRDPRPSIYSIHNPHLKDTQSEYCESEMGRHSSEDVTQLRKRGLSSVSVVLDDFANQRPGWPLLRANSMLSPSAMQARKMSVVKWVMNLPNRSEPGTPRVMTPCSSSSEISPKSLEYDTRSECSVFTETSNESNSPNSRELPEILNLLLRTNSSRCQWIGFDLLKASTSNFASENLIGKGGCHDVYKGIFPDGKSGAVKMRKPSKEAWKDYILEIEIMTSLHHKNITPLLGVCVEEDKLISVYDLVARGSLEDNLHGEMKGGLSWERRMNIAIGVAEALKYLHKECEKPVVHRDIKSSNILLSHQFEPQLSDFGLAIWGPTTSPFLSRSDIVGTFGYLAPEYFMYGKVSEKIDVYSFGVVLLELLTRKRPISLDPVKGEDSLVMWAKPKLEKGDIASILDVDLDKEVYKYQIARVALAATLCLTRSATRRPTITQVIRILRGDQELNARVTQNYLEFIINEDDNDDENDDDEVYPESNAESHLSLAFLDVEDKETSFDSVDAKQHAGISLREYLRGRWSRSSSLD